MSDPVNNLVDELERFIRQVTRGYKDETPVARHDLRKAILRALREYDNA